MWHAKNAVHSNHLNIIKQLAGPTTDVCVCASVSVCKCVWGLLLVEFFRTVAFSDLFIAFLFPILSLSNRVDRIETSIESYVDSITAVHIQLCVCMCMSVMLFPSLYRML